LLVVLRFRSSHLNVTLPLANFGIGPLMRLCCIFSIARVETVVG